MSSSRKTSTAQAELILLPNLKNCLLNLPSTLVSVLLNSNTLAQNVARVTAELGGKLGVARVYQEGNIVYPTAIGNTPSVVSLIHS